MTLKAAIIADDLTGALDTGTPFVEAGLSVAVAVDVNAAEEAVRTRADVVVINTASRALGENEAGEVVRKAARALLPALPSIVMKKIDSRLKGNVAAESIALAEMLGMTGILVAPAIPDQERITYRGCVVGRGVETPIPVADLFSGCSQTVTVADAEDDADLNRIAARNDWRRVLAVGARGLGAALARRLGKVAGRGQAFRPEPKTLFAFGSRDPITAQQMEQLEASGALARVVDAPMGGVGRDSRAVLPMLLRCTGEVSSDAAIVATRFATGVKLVIDETRPDMIMVGGGDTALAIFRELGVRVLMPKGEIEAGVPWFDVADPDGRQFRCAVKSGGFGNSNSLLKLIPRNQAA
ncbi:four-carbon acid sugar kinase family protein [Rhizobium sp. BK251]|uniref:four-carbon acid sugar kinase family protein n=1 Tax=Rhizobium sp. BK251 TaxID=2512125 RepID=UPI00104B4FA1|nr:four-carbon acid sugar kinase family protein [Rhizobium sp. BK251]TCL72859.1 uncharacterized protein YgbK (DUF1537 family) [Rhizobium sp. BK251]